MIKLNPLVVKYEECEPPRDAPIDEFDCNWYELTDKIRYLGIPSSVSYKACFHNLPTGLQTHVYAPTGLDIQEKWSVGGNMPGEPRQPIELGLRDAPREGLYLREDVKMRCNIFASDFVKRTLQRAHQCLVQRLIVRADILRLQKEDYIDMRSTMRSPSAMPSPSSYGRSFIDQYEHAGLSHEVAECPRYPLDPGLLPRPPHFSANRTHSSRDPQWPSRRNGVVLELD